MSQKGDLQHFRMQVNSVYSTMMYNVGWCQVVPSFSDPAANHAKVVDGKFPHTLEIVKDAAGLPCSFVNHRLLVCWAFLTAFFLLYEVRTG